MENNIKDLVKRGSATARNGFKNEDDVVRKFNDWKNDEDAKKWLIIMSYDLNEIERVEAVKITGSHKADVQVKIKIYLKDVIGAENISIKLVSNPTGFNQIDKRWIDKYVELWSIPKDITKALKLFTGETKPRKKGLKDPRRMFMEEMDMPTQKKIIDFFESNKFLWQWRGSHCKRWQFKDWQNNNAKERRRRRQTNSSNVAIQNQSSRNSQRN